MASSSHWVTHIALWILLSVFFVGASGWYIMRVNEQHYQSWKCPPQKEYLFLFECHTDRHAAVVDLNCKTVTKIMTAMCCLQLISMIFRWRCEPAPLQIKQRRDSMTNTSDANTSDAKASDAKASDAKTSDAKKRAVTTA
jgi:hypothetical protein